MADFSIAYEQMLRDEGGYKLHDVHGDMGGMTYAGIARKMNGAWPGWAFIDRGETPPVEMVKAFYKAGWWDPLWGDDITEQRVADELFGFAMNTSGYGRPTVAVKIVQAVVGVTPDGVVGPKTVDAINAMDKDLLLARLALAKIARYRDICTHDRSQIKFILGWINRSLRGAA